jgi:hypothetical protein
MFPTMDEEIIGNILRMNGSNFDQTLNVLLEMSDPSVKPVDRNEEDEALARRLQNQFMEEQQGYSRESNSSDDFMEKINEFGIATKNKIMEFYKKIVNATTQRFIH